MIGAAPSGEIGSARALMLGLFVEFLSIC